MNEKYSNKNFTGQDLTKIDANEFNNTTIANSSFYREGEPDAVVFPPAMTGVTFEGCNLDNCFIPNGNTIKDGCHRNIMVQNDLEDWIVDDLGNPTEPVNKKLFINRGLSIDPQDIPAQIVKQPVTLEIK